MSLVRNILWRTLLAPVNVRHCSQTVYQALLGCCRMWQATGDAKWQKRASSLHDLLQQIQRPDGGFDIGYDFNFGLLHKTGDSTAPELVGLAALCEYAQLFNDQSGAAAAHRAAEWIRCHAKWVSVDRVAVPYSPHTTNDVMVYNGTSFACGALGLYIARFGGDNELRTLYEGMVCYLDSALSSDNECPGRFWYYNDQTRENITSAARHKIDYYHQMQQVEMHAIAERVSPAPRQSSIVGDAADHIVSLHRESLSVVPYTNSPQHFQGRIHLWGLASVTSGLVEAAYVREDRAAAYREVARSNIEWILKHAWAGDYFFPVLTPEGEPVGSRQYMVRSDAWVFNALASAIREFPDIDQWNVAETCYQHMEDVNFSGPESHASNRRLRMTSAALRAGKDIAKKIRV